ncbi:alpha/beta fold hydrolase [Hyalangium rubrum]|uniref:Alpha/beta fold hydrolase n=1 Tax=Hyalangium rubrum TaxID=3103134 RepID=A0ABU5H1E6_9BACT|nr:alpha/beta fold hydrolase [Hyalangium sp. s54d21]MDY7226927.1 alpha/beta fold hydrolase [Hyalangium sp. s54d21]
MSQRIFRDASARSTLDAWYSRFLAHVRAPVTHREVTTTLGPSHVLCVGDPALPPLLVLHGAMASSAHAANELGPLAERFHVLLPDVPGQSIRGPEVRPPLKTDAHARWLLEVLDGLGLKSVDLYGISWGGFVALQTATVAPARVRRLVLLVPAGVVSGPVWAGLTQLAIPMMLYRSFPSEERLRRFATPLLTTWDEEWGRYLGDAMRSFVPDLRPPPLATAERLRGFQTPTLVVGADNDLSFPGPKLLARMKELIPHAQVELIPNCRHIPPTNDAFRGWMAERVTRFLATAGPATAEAHARSA